MHLLVVSGTRQRIGESLGAFQEIRAAAESLRSLFVGVDAEPVVSIMHGACGWDALEPEGQTVDRLRGVDKAAHRAAAKGPWARAEPMPAPWGTYGPEAGPMRNEAMCQIARYRELCGWNVAALAMPLGESRGTRDFIRAWKRTGLPLTIKEL